MNPTEPTNKHIHLLHELGKDLQYITGKTPMDHTQSYHGNIENFIGFAQVPIGIAGPLLLNGTAGNSQHYIPMATTEGALVASYNRGIKAVTLSGGFTARTLSNQVQRSPYFEFDTVSRCLEFGQWIQSMQPLMSSGLSQLSRHARLISIDCLYEGNGVHVTFSYETGAAAGQNMVTIITAQLIQQLLGQSPHQPTHHYIEGNMSGDKKANLKSLSKVRGRKVICEALITREVLADTLKSSSEKICKFWRTGTLAAVQSGAIGNNGHITNALTAIYIACGQDVACIAESAVGMVRMEARDNGDLYAALTLPGLIIGNVGGGTALPTQRESLELMDCSRPEDIDKFAEVCCAVALAGELSIGAAIAEGHFTAAHQSLGRKS